MYLPPGYLGQAIERPLDWESLIHGLTSSANIDPSSSLARPSPWSWRPRHGAYMGPTLMAPSLWAEAFLPLGLSFLINFT